MLFLTLSIIHELVHYGINNAFGIDSTFYIDLEGIHTLPINEPKPGQEQTIYTLQAINEIIGYHLFFFLGFIYLKPLLKMEKV